MSTCMRNGVSYHRHRWNEGDVCMLCGKQSRWLEEQNARETVADQGEIGAVDSFENEGGAVAANVV
jgi:hypothetical protein